MLSGNLFDAGAMAAAITVLISLVKPFVETLPFAQPEARLHDASLQLLNVLANILIALLFAASNNQLAGYSWATIVLQGLGQAAGSEFLYRRVTATANASAKKKAAKRSGSSAASSAAGLSSQHDLAIALSSAAGPPAETSSSPAPLS